MLEGLEIPGHRTASADTALSGSRFSRTARAPPSGRGSREGLADGSVDLVVGTHALLTDDVRFAALGVAVIDEQHRFGVEQRAALRCQRAATRCPARVQIPTCS